MYRKGHLGVALCCYAPVVAAITLRYESLLPFALVGTLVLVDPLLPVSMLTRLNVSLAVSMLPDLDMKIPWVTHRGITHTVWFAAFVGAVFAGITWGVMAALSTPLGIDPTTATLAVVFFGGLGAFSVLTHLLGDVLTPMGIRPFAPLWSRKFSLNVWTADNTWANGGLYVLGIGAVVAAFFAEQILARVA